jgi:hypothetical protein
VSPTPPDQPSRDAILARLAESRGEIRHLLEPPVDRAADAGPGPSAVPGGFPRSRTMQALMSGRGLGAIGAVVAGLLLARPALAWRLIRMLPTGAVTRILVARIVRALGASGNPRAAPRRRRNAEATREAPSAGASS